MKFSYSLLALVAAQDLNEKDKGAFDMDECRLECTSNFCTDDMSNFFCEPMCEVTCDLVSSR